MGQFCSPNEVAALNNDRPTSVMVGQMVSGPMYRDNNPTIPVKPRKISISEATITEPWIWNRQEYVLL